MTLIKWVYESTSGMYIKCARTFTSGDTIFIDGTHSIQTSSLYESDLNLFPNPANNELTLDYGEVFMEEARLYNLLGKDVKYILINDTKKKIDTTICIKDYTL